MVRSPSLYGVTAIVCSAPSRRIRNSIGLSPGFFEIVCAICDANTMRSPSIARITSSTLSPADSAGLPAESDATIGFDVRHHANGADFEPRAVAGGQLGEIGANLEALFAAVAQHRDFDIALGPRRHRHLEMLPGADRPQCRTW